MQVTLTVNGTEHTVDVEPRLAAGPPDPRGARAHRHPYRVRHDQLRRVHGAARRHAREVLHAVRGPGRGPRRSRRSRASWTARSSHPIQAAFKEHHGLQCGYCTPGMMLVGHALLEENPDPSDDDVRWAISGNICRCTGYMNIVTAIRAAAQASAGETASRDRLREGAEHTMVTEREEIRGVGHSVRRVEDDRFIRGRGNYIDDINLKGQLYMSILRSPWAHATLKGIDASAASALPGVVAVVTGELMAQHNLAWMPTLSGDTQAVLVTDKVRYQGQEVAAVIATDPYIAKDALQLIDVDYDPLDPIVTPQRALEADAPLIRDEKDGQTDNHIYDWEAGDKEATDAAFAKADKVVSLDTFYPRCHPVAAGDVRLRRRRRSGHGPGDDLHDVPGAAPDPDRVRARDGPARGEDPRDLPRPRRRFRQQGAGVPRLRRGDRGLAPAGQAGQVDRGPQREPDLDGVRARLPHARRDGAEVRRHDAGTQSVALGGRGRVLRRRPALEVQGRAVPHRERLLRPACRARLRRRRLHEQGARRRRVPVLVPRDRGLVPDRAPGAERRVRARHGSGRAPQEELHPDPSSSRTTRRPGSCTTRATTRRRDEHRAGEDRLHRAAQGAGEGTRRRQALRHRDGVVHRGRRRRAAQGLRHHRHQDERRRRAADPSDGQGDPEDQLADPGPGARDHLRPDRCRGARHPARGHQGHARRHGQHAVRARHLRVALDTDRRRRHRDGGATGPREGDEARRAPAGGLRRGHRVRGRASSRSRAPPIGSRRSRRLRSPRTPISRTGWSPVSRAPTTTTRRT